MTSERKQWQELKQNYLKYIEQALAGVDSPKTTEILNDVAAHLENKYTDLPPEHRTWEAFQQIITEMGPPHEYAELLTEEKPAPVKNKFGINEFLAVVFIVVLIIVGGYLIYTAKNTPTAPVPASKDTQFELDEQVLGYWVSVDFVENIEDFQPEHQQTSELFLKTLRFGNNGKLWWTIGESNPIALDWTKGKIRPLGIWPASYSIKTFDKTDFLFYEYRTKHHKVAGYYVFKQSVEPESIDEKEEVAFQEDPQVLGQWTTVDFVRTPDTFRPNQQSWLGKLFLKYLHFKERGIVEWCVGDNQTKVNYHWTKGKLIDEELSTKYFIETYEDGDYLFMEWNSGDVTIRGQKPAYYVLKKE